MIKILQFFYDVEKIPTGRVSVILHFKAAFQEDGPKGRGVYFTYKMKDASAEVSIIECSAVGSLKSKENDDYGEQEIEKLYSEFKEKILNISKAMKVPAFPMPIIQDYIYQQIMTYFASYYVKSVITILDYVSCCLIVRIWEDIGASSFFFLLSYENNDDF